MFSYKNKYFLATLAFLIVPLSGVSVDIYVPSLPAVSYYFGTSKSLSQLTITAYLVSIGCMQLFAGGVSDSFGRKTPFMLAMLVYIATTFYMPWSQTIEQLIFLRCIQGASLALAIVPMRSIIVDLFEGKELQKMMSYLTMAWSIGPIIAPAIGGFLQHYLGWKSIFYSLGAYSVILFILAWFFLFETSVQQHPFEVRGIIKRYCTMIMHREYVSSILIGGLLFSVESLFGIVGPFLIQTVLHYTADQYGHLALLMGLAWFMGSMTNRFILTIPLEKKSKICFWTMFVTSIVMLVTAIFYSTTIYNIVIPMGILFFFSGILYPSYFIRSILLFRETSASANALYNSAAFFISGIVSGLGTFIRLDTEFPFICALIMLISLCLILYYWDVLSNDTDSLEENNDARDTI